MTENLTIGNLFGQLMVQYTALFSIVNPLGSAFVFFAITRALPLAERQRLAGRVGVYTWVTLLVLRVAGGSSEGKTGRDS